MSMDPDGLRLLCCCMINRAILDMRSRGEGGHENVRQITYRAYVTAVIWLGSRKAAIYFDNVGIIEQQEALEACDWLIYARELRADPEAGLTRDERLLLNIGIKYLAKGRNRVTSYNSKGDIRSTGFKDGS